MRLIKRQFSKYHLMTSLYRQFIISSFIRSSTKIFLIRSKRGLSLTEILNTKKGRKVLFFVNISGITKLELK